MQQPNLTIKEYCIQQQYSDNVTEGVILYLVCRWQRIAEHTADYRQFYLDNYLNDLDTRQILAELLPLASEAELAETTHRVDAADAKFIANSVDVPSNGWGLRAEAKHQYTKQQNWWYYRMPKLVGPDWDSPHIV